MMQVVEKRKSLVFKRAKIAYIFLLLSMVLCATTACDSHHPAQPSVDLSSRQRFYGSFTIEKTYSFDRKYYAVQNIENQMIRVDVYQALSDDLVYSFVPARAIDFWGICWERDNYNIWIQSADVGTLCYRFGEGVWDRNESQNLPAYIISRYDDDYRDNQELWDGIYHSPTAK